MFDKLIVITAPDFFRGEADTLNELFGAGLKRLHLRKPQGRRGEVEMLINEIDPNFRKLIAVHYHQELVTAMDLGGMHFSCPGSSETAVLTDKYTHSCSLHNWNELEEVQKKIDYCFMSPVFHSISKIGYPANEALNKVPDFAKNIFALGGITEANSHEVIDKGYSGLAVLGTIWEDKGQALRRFKGLHEKLKAYGS